MVLMGWILGLALGDGLPSSLREDAAGVKIELGAGVDFGVTSFDGDDLWGAGESVSTGLRWPAGTGVQILYRHASVRGKDEEKEEELNPWCALFPGAILSEDCWETTYKRVRRVRLDTDEFLVEGVLRPDAALGRPVEFEIGLGIGAQRYEAERTETVTSRAGLSAEAQDHSEGWSAVVRLRASGIVRLGRGWEFGGSLLLGGAQVEGYRSGSHVEISVALQIGFGLAF